MNAPGESSRNSIALLSHLRWISALIVVFSHVNEGLIRKPSYIEHVTKLPDVLVKKVVFRPDGYGHAAVVVFFVLSGFLVGGKLIELLESGNFTRDWQRFLIDRFVRIFIVLWPALLISTAVGFILIRFLPHAPFVAAGGWSYGLSSPLTGDIDLGKWISVSTLLNELVAPTLIINGPVWSLAYEWSYYIMALAAVLIFRAERSIFSILTIAYGVAVLVLAARNQPDILFAGISWVAGIFARIAYNHDVMRGWPLRVLGLALVLAVLAVDHKHPLPDPVLGIALAVMIAHSGWKHWTTGAALGDRLAGFSYSLYLVHCPLLLGIMGLLYAAGELPHPLALGLKSLILAGATTALLVFFARFFACITEDRTVAVRRAVLRLIRMPDSHSRVAPALSREATVKK